MPLPRFIANRFHNLDRAVLRTPGKECSPMAGNNATQVL